MTEMQHVRAAQRGRPRRRWGPLLIAPALVAALTMAIAGPVAAAAPPTVTKVEPNFGRPSGGTTVTITGTNFTGVTAVKFGPTGATSFTVNSETSITAVSPAGTGVVDVTVTAAGGTSATGFGDQFEYGPRITNMVPKNGPNAGGTSVEIVGRNFIEVSAVKFGSSNASFKVNSETSITAVAPPYSGGSARVRVSVTTRGGVSPETVGTVLGPEYFGYAPVVTRVSPDLGPPAGGIHVSIEGRAFEAIRGPDEFGPFVTSVKFGSTNATSFEVHPVGEEASITAVAPAGTGIVDVTVETFAGTNLTSHADLFGYGQSPNTTPHWYKSGAKSPLGEKLQTIAWGTLTLESSAGNIACHSAEAANVENTAGAASQETVAFATWECKAVSGECAVAGHEARLTPRGLPWPATVIEEGAEGSGEFRQETSGVELNDECYMGGTKTGALLFKTGPVLTETGTMDPQIKNGTNGSHPSELVFTGEPGHLYAEEAKVAIQGTTKGALKVETYTTAVPIPVITLAKP